jgi:glucose/arabinose dehydrogenase
MIRKLCHGFYRDYEKVRAGVKAMTLKVSKFQALGRSSLLMLLLCAVISLFFSTCRWHRSSAGTPSIPQISLVLTAGGFSHPVHITHAGDGSGRLFVVEQGGLIKIIQNGTALPTPFLDVSSLLKSSAGEQGLLSVAFPPGYGASKQYFYIDYTSVQGVGDTVIARYHTTADSNTADPASGQTLLVVVQPFTNHNGGQLAFGHDGYLYIGMGDGGGGGDPSNNAQNPLSLLGKILRIDVESQPDGYSAPSSNPFIGIAGYRPEIWALGLRNPWRFSFDRETGDLYIADVGQGSYEEVNMQPALSAGGENYGWNIMEGFHCYNSASCNQTGMTLPIAEYGHSLGDCSVTGGFVYRGQEFSALQGVYIYGDHCSGRIWGLKRAGGALENKLILDSSLLISTFGEDEAGNLYVADHGAGAIYKIIVPPSVP